MKLQVFSFGNVLLISFFLVVTSSLVSAQVSSPSRWKQFVEDPARNTLVKDTFLFQSFENDEFRGWKYSSVNDKPLGTFQANQQFTGEGQFRSLILRTDMGVKFELLPDKKYQDVTISAIIGGRKLQKDDSLRITYTCQDGSHHEYIYFKQREYAEKVDYREPFHYEDEIRSNPMQLKGEITELSFYFNALDDIPYIGIDSVLACGNIPEYSLFEGTGRWQDTALWSHLPAARHRKALLNGKVVVEDTIHVGEIHLGEGGIEIDQNIKLTAGKLVLYGDDFYLLNKGEIISRQGVIFEKTFPTKGEWYFISFPCDIYKEDIDPEFSLKDDTPNDGGNYVYIMTYDGEKRIENNSSRGNWQVIPENFPKDKPLLEKGKGYLIALDREASGQTLAFTSKDYLNSVSGQQAVSFQIEIPVKPAGTDDENYGWYLCGNPFPAPLSLSQIVPNESLDKNIYVYNGSGYTSYSIGENVQLPPYAAFFIKAKSSTSLVINPYNVDIPEQISLKSYSMGAESPEPKNAEIPTGLHQKNNISPFYTVRENKLYINQPVSSGEVRIIDLQGRVRYKKQIDPEIFVYDLALPKGIYFMHMISGPYRFRDKFIINR